LIAAIPVIAQYGITDYAAQFKERHPEIQFTLEEREASTILPALDNRQYDLAFVRDNFLDKSRYACLELITDRLMAAVSVNHPLAGRSCLSVSELSNENFITFNPGTVVHELSVNACRSAGFEPRVYYATLRGASIIGLVASNSGIALMMEKVLNYYRRPDVVAIPLEQVIESRIVIAYPGGKKLSGPARTFLEFAEKMRLSGDH
jgi:DNA-binding transcriptional LysR family regulator